MKVICINNKPIEGGRNDKASLAKLKEGNKYIVIRIFTSSIDNRGYVLEEIPDVKDGYMAIRFIPCSEIDETTFERNYDDMLIKISK